jgi:hypothetical protein
VVATSTYSLLTANPAGLSFKAHLFLLVFVAVVGLVRSAKG